MKTFFLLPHQCKKIGWIMLLLSIVALFVTEIFSISLIGKAFALIEESFLHSTRYFQIIQTDLTFTILGLLFLVSLLLIVFSKETVEDEYISKIRLQSLLWAVAINYLLLFLSFIFIYELAFLQVMGYNMFTILILFIIKFHLSLYRLRHEK